jgi:hypothetical protein
MALLFRHERPNIARRLNFAAGRSRDILACWMFQDGGGVIVDDYARQRPMTIDLANMRWERSLTSREPFLRCNATAGAERGTFTALPTLNNWTIDCLINNAGSDANYGLLIGAGTSDGYFVRTSGTGYYLTLFHSSTEYVTTPVVLTYSTRYHVFLVHNSGQNEYYINGALTDVQTSVQTFTASHALNSPTASQTFVGTIEWMRIWGRAFPAREIRAETLRPFATMFDEDRVQSSFIVAGAATGHGPLFSSLEGRRAHLLGV